MVYAMSFISPNFDVKSISFPNFGQGHFPKIAGKSPALGFHPSYKWKPSHAGRIFTNGRKEMVESLTGNQKVASLMLN